MNRWTAICLLGLALGCGAGEPNFNDLHPGVAENELLPTLDKIAETGEYQEILLDLTIGLEREGYMQEAAMIQQCESLENPAKVKTLARQVAASVKRQKKNSEQNAAP